MRELAGSGDYGAVKKIGHELLEENADYFDVALYLARVHGWENSFDSAYMVLDEVIEEAPELYEAYETCADLAYWENNMERLDSCAAQAAELDPDSAGVFERYRQPFSNPGPSPGKRSSLVFIPTIIFRFPTCVTGTC